MSCECTNLWIDQRFNEHFIVDLNIQISRAISVWRTHVKSPWNLTLNGSTDEEGHWLRNLDQSLTCNWTACTWSNEAVDLCQLGSTSFYTKMWPYHPKVRSFWIFFIFNGALWHWLTQDSSRAKNSKTQIEAWTLKMLDTCASFRPKIKSIKWPS